MVKVVGGNEQSDPGLEREGKRIYNDPTVARKGHDNQTAIMKMFVSRSL